MDRTLIPVVFIMMTRRRNIDYIAVFTKLTQLIQEFTSSPPQVKMVMCDFEKAFWTAWRVLIEDNVYVNVKLKGCFFHFTQAVFRKVMYFGLKTKYYNDVGTRHFLKKLMVLPLLPEKDIVVEFLKLENVCTPLKVPKLKKVLKYFKNNWIYGKVWTPVDYCHFRILIRTNNEVEGSHFGMMCRVKVSKKPFST